MLEYAHADYEIYTSMFSGIKCQDDRVGERGARAEWVWEYWQNDWVFREDSEVWGKSVLFALELSLISSCRMPSASPLYAA